MNIFDMNQEEFLNWLFKENRNIPCFLINNEDDLDNFNKFCKRIIPDVKYSIDLEKNKLPFIIKIDTNYDYGGCNYSSYRAYYCGRSCYEKQSYGKDANYYRFIDSIDILDNLHIIPDSLSEKNL